MTKKTIVSTLIFSGALLATSAFAQGVYVAGSAGLGIAASSVRTDLDTALTAGGIKSIKSSMSDGTAMNAALGYEYNPNFAAEVGYFDSGTLDYTATGTGVASIKSETKVTGFQLAAVGTTPLNDKFSVFGKLGYSFLTTKSNITIGTVKSAASAKNNGVGFGLGATYKLVDNISVKASYEMIASDVSAFLVGVQIKF
jgi:OOP family OmpA-OmpF porin